MKLTPHDLRFILSQVELAEAHARGVDLLQLLGGQERLSLGLRAVDGTYNNVVPGQESFGAADRPMPGVLPQVWRAAGAATFDPDGTGPLSVGSPSSYQQTSGVVFDAQPRTISNLISDQTSNNPAATTAGGGLGATVSSEGSIFIANVSPDVGLSAPYNSLFTFFGQFFDHGLDLIGKGGNGSVVIPLQPDDPLYVPGSATNFMVLTRAQVTALEPGPDGVLGTADDVRLFTNSTTPWIDQNQTYTSHPSHQAFLRDYLLVNGRPVATGRLIDGAAADSIANWGEIKQQARTHLGIALADSDVGNVPLILTDLYGNFVPGANGFAQLVLEDGSLVEGSPTAPISTAGALRTGHAFLDDIAHHAVPSAGKTPDADTVVNAATAPPAPGTYDNELLDLHYVTGDGRGNENIALTALHNIFHSEHNRLVESVKADILAANDLPLLNQWLSAPVLAVPTTAAAIAALQWNGERLFQTARFANEMQYQHLVFEEFGRKLLPSIDVFAGYNSTVDPAVMLEFASVVYRFGHSMLTDTVDRINPATGVSSPMGLIEAFLNPAAFAASGATVKDSVGTLLNGASHQVGQEIDEFVTEALRNNLVGLPLDLGALNIARGRENGIPGLNQARRLFFADTANSSLRPYSSWNDFGQNLRNAGSLVNFIAAYGTHASILAASTDAARRAAAQTLLDQAALGQPDASAFLAASGTYATPSLGGVEAIDFWIGGLAEKLMPFGGMLGSTFSYVFRTQMERLQNHDRLYYLARTAGLNVLVQLEQQTFSEIIMRNSTARHLPGDAFSTPTYRFEAGRLGATGAILDDPQSAASEPALLQRLPDGTIAYNGIEHVVLGGTPSNDRLATGEGDDTVHGDEGNDSLEGGAGNDFIFGGAGNDILSDSFGDDNIKAGDGHDVILNAGGALDLLFGGDGSDAIFGGEGDAETFAGLGNDFVNAGTGLNVVFGNEGDDWIEGGASADLLQGDNGAPFGDSTILGNDVLMGEGNDDYDAENGDDIMFGSAGTNKNWGSWGFDWVTFARVPGSVVADMSILPAAGNIPIDLIDRYLEVEGLSGWNGNDHLMGTENPLGAGIGHELTVAGINRIAGLSSLLRGATGFTDGDILLGGGGSDTIQGRSGDDFIDGDAFLDAQIRLTNADGTVEFGGNLATFQQRLSTGAINPSQLSIHRSIERGTSGVDIAVFRGNRADYTIVRNADNTVTVRDNRAPVAGVLLDGVDTLRNIELLRFADGNVVAPRPAGAATGLPQILAAAPTEGRALQVNVSTIADVNGLGAFSYSWEASRDGGLTWVVVGTSASFTPGQAQVGSILRVQVSFVDGAGNAENLISQSTPITGDLYVGTPLANLFNGTAGADHADGGAGNDNLNGGPGADTLIGGAGNDRLNGGIGIDSMVGGLGDDTYLVDVALDSVLEAVAGGVDTIQTSAPTLGLPSEVENLSYVGVGNFSGQGNGLANRISGGSGSDLLEGLGGNDTFSGGAGNDTLLGGLGDDVALYAGPAASYVVSRIAGGTSVRSLTGTDGIDILREVELIQFTDTAVPGTFPNSPATGTPVINDVTPLAGSTLTVSTAGIADADGLGAFTYRWESATTVAGPWTAIAAATQAAFTPTAAQVGGLLRAVVSFTDGGGSLETLTSAPTGVVASNFVGTAGNDTFTGTTADDIASGLAGNDTFTGGAGNDSLNGGDGIDLAVYSGLSTAYTVTQLPTGARQISGPEGTDTLVGIEAARFSNLTLSFNSPATGVPTISDTTPISGGVLSVSTAGIADADGLGPFSYRWESAGSATGPWAAIAGATQASFTPPAGQVNRFLRAVVSFTDAAGNAETVVSTSTGVVANNFIGTLANNTFNGTAGDDVAAGLAGNDTLRGGAGNDSLNGGDGIDQAVFSGLSTAYTVTLLPTGERSISGPDGVDTLVGIEQLRFSDATINLSTPATGTPTINDLTPIAGTALTVSTAGIADADGLGAFSYRWESATTAAGPWTAIAGATLASFTPTTAQVGGLLRAVVSFTDGGGNPEALTSAPTGVVASNVVGTAGNDTFTGTAGDDIASGLAGNDTFTGGAGNDSLNGGDGIDLAVYSGLSTAYTVTQLPTGARQISGPEGTDTLVGIEAARFSNLTLSFNSPVAGVPTISDPSPTEGSALTAQTTGISDADGLGAFTYQWLRSPFAAATGLPISGATTASYTPVQQDVGQVLRVMVSFVDGAGSREEVLSGPTDPVGDLIIGGRDTADNLTGTAGADSITGDRGNDTLTGGAGNDTLNGGRDNDRLDGGLGADQLIGDTGNDVFVVDDPLDIVSELAAGGTDTVVTSLSAYTLPDNVEFLSFSGTGPFVGDGNALGNAISGGSGADTLSGGLGVDSLTGAGGADVFLFRSVAEAGTGLVRDVITDFAVGTDRIDLRPIDANPLTTGDQAFVFIGNAAFTAIGQASITVGAGFNLLQANLDANFATAELQIQLQGSPALTATSLLL
ncbi:MAG: peroxidase family protein [Prochlorococcaceae cyanobacterium]